MLTSKFKGNCKGKGANTESPRGKKKYYLRLFFALNGVLEKMGNVSLKVLKFFVLKRVRTLNVTVLKLSHLPVVVCFQCMKVGPASLQMCWISPLRIFLVALLR